MSGAKLTPEKITSPFQLMAAWFSMLILLVSVLLAAAAQIEKPEWASGYLVIFSSIVAVAVIACVLLMLTKYRPHLQDGKEYAEWIKDQGRYSSGYIKRETSSKALPIKSEKPKAEEPRTSSIKNVLVSIVNAVGSQEIVETLKNKGYNAETYSQKNKSEEEEELASIKGCQEGIWIGKRVAPDVAIPAIKSALNIWPDLKYIHIPSDSNDPPDFVNDQIFIGGASSTPISLGTKEWRLSELNALNPKMDIKDFHALIREKYS